MSRSLALLAAFVILVRTAIDAVNLLNWFAPLLLLGSDQYLGGGNYLAPFEPDQVQALALTFIRLYGVGFDIALVFFGMQCVLVGYLFFRSTFFPAVLGAGLALTGLSYLFVVLANMLAPAFGALLFLNFLFPVVFGLVAAKLWLFIMGVNVEKWRDQAMLAQD